MSISYTLKNDVVNDNKVAASDGKLTVDISDKQLKEINLHLSALSTQQRIAWALDYLPGNFALSSSFGIQSSVSLHLHTEICPNIPVIFVDTGYLFPETYRYADQLIERFSLNIKTIRADLSSAWQVARFGELWKQGIDGLDRYNQINKVAPMEKALSNLKISTWFAGIMRFQSELRGQMEFVQKFSGRFKLHPLLDWDKQEIGRYMSKHNLPVHPLSHQGYVSVGDVHSTRPLQEGMTEEETRFNGIKRECGLHIDKLAGL